MPTEANYYIYIFVGGGRYIDENAWTFISGVHTAIHKRGKIYSTKQTSKIQARQEHYARVSTSPFWGKAGGPSKAVVCKSNMTALLGEDALFIPGYEWRQAILAALYRDIALYGDTTLLGDPCCTTGDFDRLISGYRLTQTALLGDPYCTTSDFDRLISGYRLIGGLLLQSELK